MKRFYAGVGSRSAPEKVCKQMKELAKILNKDYWLRSGNADGADQAFAKGVEDEKAQIWLPWSDFNIGFQRMHPQHDYKLVHRNDKEAVESVNKFHPNGTKLNSVSKSFMVRNYRQWKGLNEPDSEFVICWTEGGKDIGGTAQCIRIARYYNSPVYNLYDLTPDQILKEIEKSNLLN
jgi:hypothetical protein